MTTKQGRFKTALVMIARNEARLISAVLHSMKPWVDEMLVLDTGSTDDTVAQAKTAGARVAHFTWVNDFSAAQKDSAARRHQADSRQCSSHRRYQYQY